MKATSRLVELLRSRAFFVAVIVGFILQSLFFAVAVNPSQPVILENGTVIREGGVVPDGNRHIGAIYYFASQPLVNGPFIHNLPNELLWMGELERFPSYLYYYLLSFPVRAALVFGASDPLIVFMIRCIGIVFGVGVLLVLRKIAMLVSRSSVVANLSVLTLAMTGAFAWLAPAENYDMLGLLFFMLFLLSSLQFIKYHDTTKLGWMLLWLLLVSITKYTYLPFAGLGGLVAVGIVIRQIGIKSLIKKTKIQHIAWYRAKPYIVGLFAVGLIISGGLFVERLGVNALQYRSADPDCDLVHEREACRNFGVFDRNYLRTMQYEQELASGERAATTYQPITYTKFWLERYYNSIFGYVGHIWIYNFWPIMIVAGSVAAVLLIGIIGYALYHRLRVFRTPEAMYLLLIAAAIVALQYVFNANLVIKYGGEMYAFGHQGRYIIAAIAIGYMAILMMLARVWREIDHEKRRRYFVPLAVVLCIVMILHWAPISFIVHANGPEWYSAFFQRLL